MKNKVQKSILLRHVLTLSVFLITLLLGSGLTSYYLYGNLTSKMNNITKVSLQVILSFHEVEVSLMHLNDLLEYSHLSKENDKEIKTSILRINRYSKVKLDKVEEKSLVQFYNSWKQDWDKISDSEYLKENIIKNDKLITNLYKRIKQISAFLKSDLEERVQKSSNETRRILTFLMSGLVIGIVVSVSFSAYIFGLIKESVIKNHQNIQEMKRQKKSLDIAALVSETNLKGDIIYVNDKFCEVSMYSRNELIGKNHRLVNSGAHDESFWKSFWTDVKSGETWKGEICNKKKDGSLYWLETTIFPKLNEYGEKIGYTAVKIDITDRKKSEVAERNALKVRSEFLSNMSHEIRTPMNGVLGMVSLLGETTLNPEQEDMLDTISSSGDSLMTILNDILDFSKIESGMLSLESRSFELERIIKDITKLCSHLSDKKKIDVLVTIDKSLPNSFMGDETRIKQIIMNYLTNAIKFTADEGKVSIKIEKLDIKDDIYDLKFSVTDTGIGISKVNQKKLFQAFVQADTSTTREFGGTGLGLAIISNLVGLMNGSFAIESEEGVGSTFSVTLPLKMSVETVTVESAAICLDGVTHKILVVDDNRINQKVAKLMLEKLGFECDISSNGQEALEAVIRTDYTLIFMDMQMPIMNGPEATQKILELDKTTVPSIVAMTANAFREDEELCIRSGMKDFISKPVKKEKLMEVLYKFRNKS